MQEHLNNTTTIKQSEKYQKLRVAAYIFRPYQSLTLDCVGEYVCFHNLGQLSRASPITSSGVRGVGGNPKDTKRRRGVEE
jgi:hypothetical protein